MTSTPKNNGWARLDEKKRKSLLYLARFGFTTRDLLAEFLGVDVKGQTKFFNRLLEEKLVKEESISFTKRKLFVLTNQGFQLAQMYDSTLNVKRVRSFSLVTLMHALTVQKTVISMCEVNGNEDYRVKSEFQLYKEPEWNRRPDALIFLKSYSPVALEVELSPKDRRRIFQNYHAHFLDYQEKRFLKVIYLFTSELIKNKYEDLYNEVFWSYKTKAGIVDFEKPKADFITFGVLAKPYEL